jgi:hypothetical protein
MSIINTTSKTIENQNSTQIPTNDVKLAFHYVIGNSTISLNSIFTYSTKIDYNYLVNGEEQTALQSFVPGRTGSTVSGLSVFQAPVNGLYQFNSCIRLNDSSSLVVSLRYLHISTTGVETTLCDQFIAGTPGSQRTGQFSLSYYMLAGEQMCFTKNFSNQVYNSQYGWTDGYLVYTF